MTQTAIVFPGQGAQEVGMGRDAFEASAAARAVFEAADEALCFSLSKLKNNISDYNRFAKSVCHALRYHSSHPLFKKISRVLEY